MQLNVLIGILALINISTGADVGGSAQAILASGSRPGTNDVKTKFLDNLINNMTIPEMGPKSDNGLYDLATRHAPGAGIGLAHDWYTTNSSQYNTLQRLNLDSSRLRIPVMQFGECLHGVGSFKQSIFPQSIGLAASFDSEMVQRVGRAIGSEARSIGIHACLGPVLDLGLELRWGRVQEGWGEDVLLTSVMGVAMSRGLSKEGNWADADAVVPVVKHFAAHGSGAGGVNGAPSMIMGTRQIFQTMLRPFKAAIDFGSVRGVMMAYSELDDIPSHIQPMLYKALEDWGFEGFVTADDAGLVMLQERHAVADSPASTISQWLNAGGCNQYYDYNLETYMDAIVGSIANGTVKVSTLQARVRSLLEVKYDLGLFDDPFIPEDISSASLTAQHIPLTLEAAQKSIVLLENRNKTLPIDPKVQDIKKIALIGPFADQLNYGDYSGQFGAYPTAKSSTIRQAMLQHMAGNSPDVDLVSSWGVNAWEFNAQVNIPGYLLSSEGIKGGLKGRYFADANFKEEVFQQMETPNRDWGIYPPNGLPSLRFSAIWEGDLTVPGDIDVKGYIGVAVSAHATANLYVDNILIQHTRASAEGSFLSNIPGYEYTSVNSTAAPPASAPFTFVQGATHKIRLEFQSGNVDPDTENPGSRNSQVGLFWNLVDRENPIQQAVNLASTADTIILAVGGSWASDGEGGDRSTMDLGPSQTALADAIFALGKPVILVLGGGRPFTIPEYYAASAAVVNTYFPGQSGGQAISDVLFGNFNPGGRIPVSVPYDIGTLPAYYSHKPTARWRSYLDSPGNLPSYSFGYGLSYTTFATSPLTAFGERDGAIKLTFSEGDTIVFTVAIENTGSIAGSYVAQVYLLNRLSSITQPGKQLMAFERVHLEPGEVVGVRMELEVDRYLPILGRDWEWELEKGEYTFALMEHSGYDADTGINATLVCV